MGKVVTAKGPDMQKIAQEITDITLYSKAGMWDHVKATIIASQSKEVWMEGLRLGLEKKQYRSILEGVGASKENPEAAKCALELAIEKKEWGAVTYICNQGLPEVGKHGIDILFEADNLFSVKFLADQASPEVREYARQKLKEMKEK